MCCTSQYGVAIIVEACELTYLSPSQSRYWGFWVCANQGLAWAPRGALWQTLWKRSLILEVQHTPRPGWCSSCNANHDERTLNRSCAEELHGAAEGSITSQMMLASLVVDAGQRRMSISTRHCSRTDQSTRDVRFLDPLRGACEPKLRGRGRRTASCEQWETATPTNVLARSDQVRASDQRRALLC